MDEYLKIENISTLISATTAVAVLMGILFLMGYTANVSPGLFAYISYRDVLLVAAQSFILLIGSFAIGVVAGYGIPAVKASGSGARAAMQKDGLVISFLRRALFSRKMTFELIALLFIVSTIVLYQLLPKGLLRVLAVIVFGIGIVFKESYLIRLKGMAGNSHISWISIVINLAIIGAAAYIFGNGSFYDDLFSNPTRVTVSKEIDGSKDFVLVRRISDGTVLFNPKTARIYILDGTNSSPSWIRINTPICDESSYHQILRRAGRKDNCS